MPPSELHSKQVQSKDKKDKKQSKELFKLDMQVIISANMKLRLKSEIHKDILTFLEKYTAYSFLP